MELEILNNQRSIFNVEGCRKPEFVKRGCELLNKIRTYNPDSYQDNSSNIDRPIK